MFTLISYKLTVSGEVYECHKVHMTFEVDLALAKYKVDSRYSNIKVMGQFDKLNKAQSVQNKLRLINSIDLVSNSIKNKVLT